MKRILAIVVAVSLVMCMPLCASANDTTTFMLRIEGIDSNLFYGEVTVLSDGTPTVAEVLALFDEQNTDITVSGISGGYISGINGENAGAFGSFDGWMFEINGIAPNFGIADCSIATGDSLLLYYGDPYGSIGMQYPVIFADGLDEGYIRVISYDTIYRADYSSYVLTAPVEGLTVTLTNSLGTNEYVSDENGIVRICDGPVADGSYNVQISRASEEGCPTALRLKPDYTLVVDSAVYTAGLGIDGFTGLIRCAAGTQTFVYTSLAENSVRVFNSQLKQLEPYTEFSTGSTIRCMAGDANGMVLVTVAVIGDVDGDGVVNTSDARASLRIAVGLDIATGEQILAADIVDNDRVISTDDARRLLRVAVELEDYSSLIRHGRV